MHAPALRTRLSPVLVALVALAAGCKPQGGGTKPEGTAPPAKPTPAAASDAGTGPILVGHFASMSGDQATFGQSTDNGIRLALEERNARGGVKGRTVEVKTYDDQGKPQEAGTAVIRLITDDKVVALLGEVASSLSIAGGRVAQQYGVPMISPSSTNAQVTQIGDMISRVCFVDSFQGYAGAKFAKENLALTKIAVLYDQTAPYS